MLQVSSKEKAQELVRDCKFPPQGRRGFGGPFTHGLWGLSAGEYLSSANEGTLVIAQIETKEGVENVEDIAGVDGLGKRSH